MAHLAFGIFAPRQKKGSLFKAIQL